MLSWCRSVCDHHLYDISGVSCAAAALLARLQLSGPELADTCASLPSTLADAAAALHGTNSRLPLPAKLASCRLLANLVPSQDMAAAVLPETKGQSAVLSLALLALSAYHLWLLNLWHLILASEHPSIAFAPHAECPSSSVLHLVALLLLL